jgi:ABC-type nitrate/sulfonate/bicarbonate transport system substrate-binding protein
MFCVVAAALALALAAGPRPRREPARIVLGVSALRISMPLFLAVERGTFGRHGLAVTVRAYPTAQPMLDDLALGRLDAAGFAAWPIVLLSSRRAAEPLRVTATLEEDLAHRLSYVLARRGSGLRFPQDVVGRRVGVLPTVAYRRWLAAILRAAGVDPEGVTVVPVEPSLQAQTLAAGGVDLMFTNDPMATAMLARGVADLADDGPPCARRLGSPFRFGAFVLSGALVEHAPDVARRLSAAVDEAVLEARSDPAGARRAMAAQLRPEERAFVDRYPAARFLTARESVGALARELSLERTLGIVEGTASVEAFP